MTGVLFLFQMFTGFILIPQPPIVVEGIPLLAGVASYYNYELTPGDKRSESHDTCAFHARLKTYKYYKVCNTDTGKCGTCYNNDWMRNDKRVVDLSSSLMRKIGSTRRGLINVEIFNL